eukprot:TRINITY_DN1484_c0_g3_i1.p1 TRINITY_DN1484_c0_g3~~TRINITY_DN1484_c0_g3_i1.p1  ORF type:complete len:168 (+),score=27.70 TRINITY_DN1484_c0_g3_i1:12-515(+)
MSSVILSSLSNSSFSRGVKLPTRNQRTRTITNQLFRHKIVCCNQSAEENKSADDNVQGVVLPACLDIEADKQWISSQIQQWLDDEWTPLEIHGDVGNAAAEAYAKLRDQGEDELNSVLLGMGQELLTFNYRDTFVSAFDVANKVSDMLMMRMGIDVCCTSQSPEEIQ